VPDEPNGIRRVEFACHLTEPVKVLADWEGAGYCLLYDEIA